MKTPRPFRKPLPERKYFRRIRNRIYLEPDRAFLDDIVTRSEDQTYMLERELDDTETKRLAKIVKEARKNRGTLAIAKLIVLAVIAGAVLLFNVLFRDRLVEQGAERLLESIFEAQADITGVAFRPIAGEIAFDRLEVADAARPMTNVFVMDTGRVLVDTWQLVNGRVVIEDLTVAGIAFGTPREASGALEQPDGGTAAGDASSADGAAGDPPGTSGTPRTSAAEPISFASLGLPETLDAQAFVAEYADEFVTYAAAEALYASSETYVERWTGEAETLINAGLSTANEVTTLASTDFTAIRSVDEAVALVETAQTLYTDTETYVDRVESAYGSATSEARSIISDATAIPDLIEEDYQRVRDAIPDVRSEGTDFLVGLIEPYLRQRLGAWYDRMLVAYDVAQRVRDQIGERPDRARRAGRLVDFGVAIPPQFELQNALLSVDGRVEQSLSITGLSSDPDRSGVPTEVAYSSDSSLRSIEAVLDGRTNAVDPFVLDLRIADSPLAISEGLEAVGLTSFSADADVAFAVSGSFDRRLAGSIDLQTTNLQVAGTGGGSSLGGLLQDLFERTPILSADFVFSVQGGQFAFENGATNLDEGISGLVQERIDATIVRFEAEVQAQIDALLGPELESINAALSGVVDTERTLEDLLLLAQDREAAAAALQERAVNATEEIANALEAEARARLDAARAEAEAAAAEAAARAEAAASEAAEEARREAEEAAESAAEEAVENLRNRIQIPGRR